VKRFGLSQYAHWISATQSTQVNDRQSQVAVRKMPKHQEHLLCFIFYILLYSNITSHFITYLCKSLFYIYFYHAAWNASADQLRESSLCPSVCLSNAWIVTKRKKDLSRFLDHTEDHLAEFSEKKNGWSG